MSRVFSAFAMGGLFLMISPKLRTELSTGFGHGVQKMDANSPYSYIGLGVLILTGFLISVYRGSRAH